MVKPGALIKIKPAANVVNLGCRTGWVECPYMLVTKGVKGPAGPTVKIPFDTFAIVLEEGFLPNGHASGSKWYRILSVMGVLWIYAGAAETVEMNEEI